jgi:hypothetical protein
MPLFIPQIELNYTGPNAENATVYYVSVEYKDASGNRFISKQRVIYVPQSNIYDAPPAPLTSIATATLPYYWLNNIQAFICMINRALKLAYDDIITQATTAGFTLPATWVAGNQPYLLWDATTAEATFVAPALVFAQDCLDLGTATGFVYFNNPLFTLFSSFQSVHNYTYNPNPLNVNDNEANYLLKVFNKQGGAGNNYVAKDATAGPPFDALYMKQPYSTGATLCPIQSLVFTTTLMPVLPQLIGIPRVLSNNNGSVGQNDNLSNEITDLVVNLTTGTEYFPNVLYLPTAEYRMIDLQGNAPLYGIQISVQWKDVYGIYHDFFLQNGCSCSLKIMFRKKDYSS